MHHRFGAYGQLLALFRGIFLGVRHGSFYLPARRGKLFDPNAFPFLEGALPGSTAAVLLADERARVVPPSIDDGTIYRVLRSLIMLDGQRLSYRTLDVEQLGSVYESLMGYHVLRVTSPAVRVGKYRVWVEASEVAAKSPSERKAFWKEACGLNPGPAGAIEAALKEAGRDLEAVSLALLQQSAGGKAERERQRAETGSLVLQPGEERRRTGTHYTPRSLTERVVKKTLEPLLACLGTGRTAQQILQLKICDPAMGSGAFLVAACRQLASEVVDAWQRSGEIAKLAEQYARPELQALRLVAQQCLYGVDKNPAAVELAKLSIWLVTLSHDRPFTFLDHALRHGDSLVGLSLDQIKAFHWKAKGQLDFCNRALTEALDQAVALRSELVGLADHDDEAAQSEKRRLLEFSQQALARIRLIADVCVGAFFAETSDKAREAERVRRLDLVRRFLGGERDVEAELVEAGNTVRKQIAPFHWMLEFPEVFFEMRADPLQQGEVNGAAYMEAVVGNPPFAGKSTIAEGSGPSYVEWLQTLHPGAHGNSDLSAHFFRRADTLLGPNGTFGLIATNTIAQGDTRATGLKALLGSGWRIYEATSALGWPGAAAVTVSLVHAAHGRPARLAVGALDGYPTPAINSRLRPNPERSDPKMLLGNAEISFQGTVVLGMGFTLTLDERAALVARDARNAQRTLPYLGGEEINTNPKHEFERYVINFGQLQLDEAECWPDLLRIVREKVKPERDLNKREVRRKYWWRFGEATPALYVAISASARCLATSIHSKHLVFAFQPTTSIFSHGLNVFAFENFSPFATLQSRVHEGWARLLSSSLEDRLRYAASDCFETFPFPKPDPRTVIAPLEQIGQQLYDTRARLMVDTDQGLTKTYNALKDPACDDPRILDLRTLHEAMDRAVLETYGWSDIEVPPFCPRTPAERALVSVFEDEVIDRLYQLNETRAAEEARAGLGQKAKPTPKSSGKRGAKNQPPADADGNQESGEGGQGKLF
jgi:N-6 DNA Methylase